MRNNNNNNSYRQHHQDAHFADLQGHKSTLMPTNASKRRLTSSASESASPLRAFNAPVSSAENNHSFDVANSPSRPSSPDEHTI
ncbi:hypothetical protein E8E11_001210 [Didymella keratinophila]|nr:hypothetical protein E8E11_001210 [Didymella keratinophila]